MIDGLPTPASSSPRGLDDIPVLAPSPRRPISLRDGSRSPINNGHWSPRVEVTCEDNEIIYSRTPSSVASARSSRPASAAGEEQYLMGASPSCPSATPEPTEDTGLFDEDVDRPLVDYDQEIYEEAPPPVHLEPPVEEVPATVTRAPSPMPEPKVSSKKEKAASKKKGKKC